MGVDALLADCSINPDYLITNLPINANSVQSAGLIGSWGRTAFDVQRNMLVARTWADYTELLKKLQLDPLETLKADYQTLAILAIVGIVVGLLVAFCGVLFYSVRACYYKCCHREEFFWEKKAPRRWKIFSLTAIMAVNVFLISFACALSITDLARGLSSVSSLHNGSGHMLDELGNSLTKAELAVNSSSCLASLQVGALSNQLSAEDYAGMLDASVGVNVDVLADNLGTMQQVVSDTLGDIAYLNATVIQIQEQAVGLNSSLTALTQRINRLRNVTVLNVTHTLPLPSTADIIRVPEIGALPSTSQLTSVLSQLDISTTTQSLYTLYNDTSNTLVLTVRNAVSELNATLQATFSGALTPVDVAGIRTTLDNTESVLDSAWSTYATRGQQGVTAAVLVPVVLMLLAALIGCGGVVTMHKPLLRCLVVVALICAPLVWIEASVFYLVSAPINEVCMNKDSLLTATYTEVLDGSSYLLQPQTLLDNCRSDISLFDMPLINGTETIAFKYFGINLNDPSSSIIAKYFNVTAELEVFRGDVIGQVPDISVNTDFLNQIDDLNLEQFNFTAFLPSFGALNVSQVILQLQNASDSLSPQAFGFDPSEMQTELDAFNGVALKWNSTWLPWSLPYVDSTFVTGDAQFSASMVSSNPAGESEISESFERVYVAIETNNTIAIEIVILRQNITEIEASILEIQSEFITPIEAEIASIGARVDVLNVRKTELPGHVTALNNSIAALSASVPIFVNVLFDDISQQVLSGSASLDSALKRNVQSMGSCQAFGGDIDLLLDASCDYGLNSLSGLWASLLMLGISLIFAAVCGHCACTTVDRGACNGRHVLEDEEENPLLPSFYQKAAGGSRRSEVQ